MFEPDPLQFQRSSIPNKIYLTNRKLIVDKEKYMIEGSADGLDYKGNFINPTRNVSFEQSRWPVNYYISPYVHMSINLKGNCNPNCDGCNNEYKKNIIPWDMSSDWITLPKTNERVMRTAYKKLGFLPDSCIIINIETELIEGAAKEMTNKGDFISPRRNVYDDQLKICPTVFKDSPDCIIDTGEHRLSLVSWIIDEKFM